MRFLPRRFGAPFDGDVDEVAVAIGGLPPMTGTMDDFVSEVSARRERRIEVLNLPEGVKTGSLCGAWIPGRDQDFIFISPDVKGAHRDHVLAHELGHVELNHQPGEMSSVLTHVVDPAEATQMLGRTSFSDPQEREAERFAEQLLSPTRGTNRGAWANDRQASRAAAVFGGTG